MGMTHDARLGPGFNILKSGARPIASVRRVESVTRDCRARGLGCIGHQRVEVAGRQRRRTRGASQTLRAAESLDQSDVEEREKDAGDEEPHRRFDPVENVAGPRDVAERAQVDEKVLAASDRRQLCRPGSTQVRRRAVGEVAPCRGEVDPDVVVGGVRHRLRVADELRRVTVGGGGGRLGVVDEAGRRQRRGAEQVERRQVAEYADDVRHDHDRAASVATRQSPAAGPHAAPAVGPARVEVVL